MLRPKLFDPITVHAAAAVLTRQLQQTEDLTSIPHDEAALIRDLLQALQTARSWDAYKLARVLDDMGWIASVRLVYALHSANAALRKAYVDIVKSWVQTYSIRPQHQVGDWVRVRAAPHVKGTVVRIDTTEAYYILQTPDMSNITVPYEYVDNPNPIDTIQSPAYPHR